VSQLTHSHVSYLDFPAILKFEALTLLAPRMLMRLWWRSFCVERQALVLTLRQILSRILLLAVVAHLEELAPRAPPRLRLVGPLARLFHQ
jgi:hypothetical protein